MVVEDLKPQPNDYTDQVKFFLKELSFLLSPQKSTFSISFPLVESFQHREERFAAGSHLNPSPPSISTTESFSIPSFYNYNHKSLNPLIPIWVNGREVPSPVSNLSQDEKVLNIQALEFLMFTKTVVSHFVPVVVRILQFEEVTEEDFLIPFGVFPDDVATSLITRLESVMTMNIPVMNLFGAMLSGIFRSLIYYTQQRFDESRQALEVVNRLRTNVLFHDMALTSPAFLLPPMLLVICHLCMLLEMSAEHEVCLVFLRHYDSIGYTIVQQGLNILLGIKQKLHPSPENLNVHSTKMMHPVGTSSETTLTHFSLKPGEEEVGEQYQEETISSPFNFLGQDFENSLDSDLELTPLDMMFSFLDPANEGKVLEELGPLFAELDQKV